MGGPGPRDLTQNQDDAAWLKALKHVERRAVAEVSRIVSAQFVGPVALLAAVGAANLAASALNCFPSSEWLWSINLGYFNAFQQSHYKLDGLLRFGDEQFFLIAAPLFLAAAAGVVFNRRILLGIASNLSLVYVAFVLVTWLHGRSESPQASLVALYSPSAHPDAAVLLILIGLSLFSFAVTHIDFLRRALPATR